MPNLNDVISGIKANVARGIKGPLDDGVLGVGVPTFPPGRGIDGVNETRLPSTTGLGGFGGFLAKKVTRLDIDMTVARLGVGEQFQFSGTVLWCADGTNATTICNIRLDVRDNDTIPFLPGTRTAGIPFDKFWITNAAQAAESLTLIITTDSPDDRVDLQS